jgi:hypothetical protein
MYSYRRHLTDVFTPRCCVTTFDRDRQDENRRARFEAARVRRREQESGDVRAQVRSPTRHDAELIAIMRCVSTSDH